MELIFTAYAFLAVIAIIKSLESNSKYYIFSVVWFAIFSSITLWTFIYEVNPFFDFFLTTTFIFGLVNIFIQSFFKNDRSFWINWIYKAILIHTYVMYAFIRMHWPPIVNLDLISIIPILLYVFWLTKGLYKKPEFWIVTVVIFLNVLRFYIGCYKIF